MALKIPILYTPRLKLKTLKVIDTGKFFVLIKENRERLKEDFPITTKKTTSFEKTESYLNELIKGEKEKQSIVFGIWLKKELIGCISAIKIDWTVPKCELAYYIDQKYEGMGFIRESIREVCRFCFTSLDMAKICIRATKKNSRSQKTALAAGFIEEGILKDEFRTGENKVVDVVYFGMTRKRFRKTYKGS